MPESGPSRTTFVSSGVGLTTAIAAAAAVTAGVVAAPIGAAVAGVGLLGAAIGAIAGRRRAPETPPEPTGPDYAAQLDAVMQRVSGKANPMVEARVARVVKILRDILPRLDQLSAGSQMAHLAVQTATSYLPEALGAYLRLPRDFADKRAVSGGKTSLMVLCDQLDLLASEMDKVFVAVVSADVDSLVAHGRFLQEKFGSGSSLQIAPELGP